MVKFSKELEAQLIPEWKDAFVNYWQLKKSVKKIKLLRKQAETEEKHDFGFSIFDPIRYSIKMFSSRLHNNGDKGEIIQVRSRSREGDEEAFYQTELVKLFSEEDEVKEFFERLDEELNKVNKFYKNREKELLERGDVLKEQLEHLLERKQILKACERKNHQPKADYSVLSRSNSSSFRGSDYSSESPTDFSESPVESPEAVERGGINVIGAATRAKTKKGKPKRTVKIDIPATTPTRAISNVTSILLKDLANSPKKKEGSGDAISGRKIQCAEKMIRGAFVDLYRGLGLLKTYSSLNMMAFKKILKKFDKVANQQTSESYLKVVKRSHFCSSDKVVTLADEVESIFTKHFTKNDRKRAMKFLRPQQHKESHVITFLAGLFTGCFVTLFCVYGILAHLTGMFSTENATGYMETIYPVFSMFALFSLHLFLYGCNLFMWRSTRINYNFIFDFFPSTALKYRDVFLICTSFMTAVVGAMVIQLLLTSNGFSQRQVDAIPGILLLFFTTLLICPLNTFYRSSRYCFIRLLRNIICSPFYKVLMVDFFLADQLTSQIPLLRHMESTACFFLAGRFKTHQIDTCNSGKLYRELAYFISFLPYYWRAMQCARRWFDEGDTVHLANLGKYVSAMVAAFARITFSRQPTHAWMFMVITTSSIATIYQLYWDFVKDWGILNPKSKNPWLRDDLILKNKSIYYVSIVLNLVLRLAWVETIMHFNGKGVESRLVEFFLASLEIIRRGHWNFYRLENEHLNNAGKFMAVKTVPLPFREMDSDD